MNMMKDNYSGVRETRNKKRDIRQLLRDFDLPIPHEDFIKYVVPLVEKSFLVKIGTEPTELDKIISKKQMELTAAYKASETVDDLIRVKEKISKMNKI